MSDNAPEVYVACEECGGEGHVLETIHVYETGCGFSHPDIYAKPCAACNGTGGMICEAEGVRFTNFFGRVKNPCEDCLSGECTMNCSGREPAGPSGDKGTLILTREKDGTVTVVARTPDEYGESKVNIPGAIWHAMLAGIPAASSARYPVDVGQPQDTRP